RIRTRLPDGASRCARVPPPAPEPMMITSYVSGIAVSSGVHGSTGSPWSVQRDVWPVAILMCPDEPPRRGVDLQRRRVVAAKVVPGPGQEGIDLGMHAAQQHRVHAQPRGEREGTLDLVAVLADLGDGGVAADHPHDAF